MFEKPTTADCVAVQKHVRARSFAGLTVALAMDIADRVMLKRFPNKDGHPCGTFVNEFGQVHSITAPVRKSISTHLRPVSIASLVAVDGVVDDAETAEDEVCEDDPAELSVEDLVRRVDESLIPEEPTLAESAGDRECN